MRLTITFHASLCLMILLAGTALNVAAQDQDETLDDSFLKSIGKLINQAGISGDNDADGEKSRERLLADYVEKGLEGRFKVVNVQMDIRPGVHEVVLEDGSAMYALGDSEYFIVGDLYRFKPGAYPTNITEAVSRAPLRVVLVDAIDEKDLIIFPADGVRKASITVFTDVDCGYCRKLHQEVPELNANGVEVRYAAYPRAGPNSVVAEKMSNAWCATDRQSAITRLKRGENIKAANCAGAANIGKQYEIGQRLGITGTPSIVSSQGKFQPGYLSADELLKWLEI